MTGIEASSRPPRAARSLRTLPRCDPRGSASAHFEHVHFFSGRPTAEGYDLNEFKSLGGRPMTTLLQTYLAYLGVSLAMTIWVARTLHRNGRPFLVDAFRGNEALADSVNHLLVVGFYLLNLGFICLNLTIGLRVADATTAVEVLSWKIGLVVLVLGGLHFFNLGIFARIRRATTLRDATPPVAPDGMLAGPTAGA